MTASHQFCGAITLRENGFLGCSQGSRISGHSANQKGLLDALPSTANRSRRQDVLDCPSHGFMGLPRAVRGRKSGAVLRVERTASAEAGTAKGPSSGLKYSRGRVAPPLCLTHDDLDELVSVALRLEAMR
jgi:hypothetical protein